MKTRRKRYLAACLVFLLLGMMLMPLIAYGAGPKEGDYVDPVEYYDLAQFAGIQLSAQSDIRDAILDKEFLPVELVLKPLKVSTSAIRLAHGNSGDLSPLEDYEVFQGEPWVIKLNEKSSYTVVHETGTAGTHHHSPGQVFPHDYNYQWQSGVNLTFDDVLYYIKENNWVGKFFNLDYQSAGYASSSGSQEYFQPEDNRNMTFMSRYAFEENVENKRIRWFVDDTGILKLWIDTRTTPGGIFEEWHYENPDEILRESMDMVSATVYFQVEKVKLGKVDSASVGAAGRVDTKADKDVGETDVSIPEALAIVIIGGGAALAGAGAGGSGGGDGDDNGRKKKSRYKMCLKKDFGDTIRYDAQPVTVYARIVEVTPEGEEIDRPDLTAFLEIFSGGNLAVEGSSMAGNYMGALVSAKSVPGGQNPNSGVLSIRFSGEGGSFQNNVTFRLVGDPYISLAGSNISVLVGSKEQFVMPVEFVDFTEPPANIVLDGDPLPITVEQDEEGNYYIKVTDDTPKPEAITKFYEEIPCTISANSGEEVVKARFSVLKCYEGILADFLGKGNEIMAYKNEDGEMPTTNIGFQAGVWDKNGQQLNLIAPKSMEMFYKDKEGIYEVIGLSFKENTDLSTSAHTVYSFTADKSLPSPEKIEGTLAYSGKVGDTIIKNETTIYLIPDLLTYAKEFEEEFKNCEHIIFTYMSGELMKRKAAELYRDKSKLGIKDLQAFRRHCWEIAKRMVLQKKEDYLKESYWYDERIAELELVTFVGDGAFAVALTPLGGPITAFLVDNAKSTFLELCEIYVKEGDAFTWEALEEVVWNRFKQTIGSVDNFVGMPEDASWKVKTAWVCSYFLYRVFYHWYYDEDDAGNSLGIVAALENAALDFGVSRITALFGDYVKGVAKKDGIDFSKRIIAEEDAVEKALAGAFDMADKGAGALDNAVETIIDFIKSIQVG